MKKENVVNFLKLFDVIQASHYFPIFFNTSHYNRARERIAGPSIKSIEIFFIWSTSAALLEGLCNINPAVLVKNIKKTLESVARPPTAVWHFTVGLQGRQEADDLWMSSSLQSPCHDQSIFLGQFESCLKEPCHDQNFFSSDHLKSA